MIASGWHINVGAGNSLSSAITANQSAITPKTRTSFIKRSLDRRKESEKNYGLKYVISQDSSLASPPIAGFSIAETSTVPDDTNYQNDNNVLTSSSNLRQPNNIINASWGGNVGIITAEQPHGLKVGHIVQVYRIRSSSNTSGTDDSGFNGIFEVSAIPNDTTFRVGLNTNPGGITTISTGTPYTFHDRTIVGSGRTFSPYFVKRDFNASYQIHSIDEIQEYKQGVQDGEYDLTLRGYISQPEVSPFSTTTNYFGQDISDIVPLEDVDNRNYDPKAAVSYAVRDEIGKVETNDPERSITKESLNSFLRETGAVKSIDTTATSSGTLTINTVVDHGFNGIVGIQSITGGTQYGTNSGNAEFYFNVRLEGGTGEGATADVTVNAGSVISGVEISNPGSGYSVNDILTVKGVPFHTPGTDCTVGVAAIDNKVGDVVEIVGVSSESYDGLYRIKEVTDKNTFTVNGTADGSGTGGHVYHVGISTNVVNINHDAMSGIATVFLSGDIGLRRGDQIVIAGATDFASIYNGTHFITDRVGYGTSLSVNIGITSNAPAFTGVATAHGTGISVRGHGRGIPLYGGHTTKINNDLTSTSTGVTLANKGNLKRGDFLIIEDEIVMVSNTAVTTVIRGALGTNAVAHGKEVSVRKIKPIPTENRRYSILRASGHTFEYVGFGPGNYSTAMPQVQDRVRSEEEELIAQSLQTRGGFVVYTGMNDGGDFYIGNLKIEAGSNSIKFLGGGRVGADEAQKSTGLPSSATFDDLVADSTFQSNGETEVIDIVLKGNQSGDIGQTVIVGIQGGSATPTSNLDQILFKTSHDAGGYIGWVKTNNSWKRFGPISKSGEVQAYEFDTLQVAGVSTYTGDVNTNKINASDTVTATDFVGNGTIPIGGIIMWSGADNAVPSNWALCNGSNGTPNLQDKFVVGRGGSYGQGQTGGEATKTLGTANLPSHTHTDGTLAATGGDHSHTITDPGHKHTPSSTASPNSSLADGRSLAVNDRIIGNYGSGSGNGLGPLGNRQFMNDATTGISVNASGNLSLDVTGNTGDQGGTMGQSFDILPPYYAIAYIMRIS